MRKAQITLFMIIGVLIIALGAVFYMLNQPEDTGVTKRPNIVEDASGVQTFVQACVESTAQDALIAFGVVGDKSPNSKKFARYYSPDPTDTYYKIPYYYYGEDAAANSPTPGKVNDYIPPFNKQGFKIVPGKIYLGTDNDNAFFDEIIGKYVEEHLIDCTKDLPGVAKGFTIDEQQIKEVPVTAKATITKDNVQFLVKYPIDIQRDGQKQEIMDYSYIHAVRLKEMLNIARDIVQKAHEHEDIVYWDYMTDVTRKNYNFTAYAERDHTIVYRLIDLQNKAHYEPYTLQWAMRVRVE